jgi:hypothetical protein
MNLMLATDVVAKVMFKDNVIVLGPYLLLLNANYVINLVTPPPIVLCIHLGKTKRQLSNVKYVPDRGIPHRIAIHLIHQIIRETVATRGPHGTLPLENSQFQDSESLSREDSH